MTREELQNGLRDVSEKLAEIATAAAKLENKNFADIVAGAKGRIQQLADHPDLELVHAEMSGGEPLPFDPKAGANVGGPDRGKKNTYVPGEPRFDPPNQNQNFQKPNAVDLNADGTLGQAPNSKGTQPDVRE